MKPLKLQTIDSMTHQAINDHSQHKDNREKTARWKKKLSNFAIAIALLFSFCLIAFSVAIPEILHRNHIAALRERGAHVVTVFDTPEWLEKITGNQPQFRFHEKVLGIDFSQHPATNQDLQSISDWSILQFVVVTHANISEQAVSQLLSYCPELKRLQIVSCPNIMPAFIHKMRSKYPTLIISYRGVAYLGIAGKAHPKGCEIFFIDPGKPADKAGLKIGDIVTAFDSKTISSFEQLVDIIGEYAPGDEVVIDVLRQNQKQSSPCTLTDWSGRLR